MKHQFWLFDLGNMVSAQSPSTNEPTRVRKRGHLCHVLSIIKIGDVVVRSDAGRGETCPISLYGARTFIVSSPLDAIVTHTFVFHYILRFYLWADCGEIDVTL